MIRGNFVAAFALLLSSGTGAEEVEWEGRIRAVSVERDGAVAFSLDGKTTFPFACGSGSQSGMVGLVPEDVGSDAIKAIDMILETVRLAVNDKRDIRAVIDGCSANGRWYRLKSVHVEPR